MEPTNNERTVESYELIAEDYARQTEDGHVLSAGLTQLAERVPGGHVLEIGSGPGWDADSLEAAGLTVRRTDITQAFIDLQLARGKAVDRLDVIKDELGGPYDGVVSLHVLQHVEPDDFQVVLSKIAGPSVRAATSSSRSQWAKASPGRTASPATSTSGRCGPRTS